MSPYNVAVKDWFTTPQVKGIDLSGWNGAIGEPVRIQAHDDVMVKHMTAVAVDLPGNMAELSLEKTIS